MSARDSLRDLLGWTNGDQVTIPRALAEALVLDEPGPTTVEVVDIATAAAASGYSTEHLRRLVRIGRIPNLGGPHRPRVRLSDLPKKPGTLTPSVHATHNGGAGRALPRNHRGARS